MIVEMQTAEYIRITTLIADIAQVKLYLTFYNDFGQ